MASMRLGMVVMMITVLCLLSKTHCANPSQAVDIPDFQTNATVLKLVDYALTDYNTFHHVGLVFQKVVGAKVEGTSNKEATYYILIQVLDANKFVDVFSAQILYREGTYPWVQIFTPLLAPTPL